MTTEDCRQYLITNWSPKIKAQYEEVDPVATEEDKKYSQKVIKDAFNPKKWKRVMKYNVGSNTDQENCDYGSDPKYVGGVVRAFYLQGTDHITINLIEKDGQIIADEDMGD